MYNSSVSVVRFVHAERSNAFICLTHRLGVIINCSGAWFSTVKALLKNVCMNPRHWWHQRKKGNKPSSSKKLPYSNRLDNSPANLTSNISLPQTGEEAMKRLFACKGKDPYRLVHSVVITIGQMFTIQKICRKFLRYQFEKYTVFSRVLLMRDVLPFAVF